MAEAVVLHSQVSYVHPESNPTPGQPHALAWANRGDVLSTDDNDDLETEKISDRDLTRLEKLGAVTTKTDSQQARLAKAGVTPDARQSGASYLTLSSPQEAIAAAKATGLNPGGVGPQSSRVELMHLQVGDLRILGAAYGVPQEVLDEGDRDSIIDHLVGDSDDATPAEEIAEQRQLRDEGQVGTRVYGGERGMLGTDVADRGVRASTGERSEPSRGGRRRSRASSSDSGDSGTSGTSGDS